MKKITLFFLISLLAIGASGVYAYNEGMLDDLIGDEEEEEKEPVSSGNAPIARITPSNPKIQINETISFSGSDSTDADGDQLSFVWSFEGDSKQYEGASIDRNYPDKGEFLVKLVVTDSTGISDEIETTVLVVEDYHASASVSLRVTRESSSGFILADSKEYSILRLIKPLLTGIEISSVSSLPLTLPLCSA
jgi:hypothetical protein